MTDHPITPPPELVESWILESDIPGEDMCEGIATRAAQWAADQELEACCEELSRFWYDEEIVTLDDVLKRLRVARRPKPPSLKEQALGALGRFNTNAHMAASEMMADFDTIRRALEALPE